MSEQKWKLVPENPALALDMGWAYLDAAREAEPNKEWSFSHAGYRAMLAAAPQPPALGGEPELPERREWVDGIEYQMTFLDGWNKCHDAFMPHVARLQAEVERLTAKIVELEKDKDRIDSLEANYWDVRHSSSPIADTGDHSTSIEIVGHWMDKPHERVIGENYNENLRAALDQAMSADAYPPERPEYPEIDAALAEGKEHE